MIVALAASAGRPSSVTCTSEREARRRLEVERGVIGDGDLPRGRIDRERPARVAADDRIGQRLAGIRVRGAGAADDRAEGGVLGQLELAGGDRRRVILAAEDGRRIFRLGSRRRSRAGDHRCRTAGRRRSFRP